ncbi:MAG: hypothetical protein ABIV25_11415 [Paracoccaceae bacterium]
MKLKRIREPVWWQDLTRLFDAWMGWLLAARWIYGIGLFWIVSALFPAFSGRIPATAFGENFIALSLHYGLMFGSIALGIWLGPKVTERTGKAWPVNGGVKSDHWAAQNQASGETLSAMARVLTT